MQHNLVIKNGTIITSEAVYQADIGIQGERIAAIGTGLSGDREIDAIGKLVTPGAIDVHVHHQMPLPSGVISADDFFTGTRAAAYGGTTTIIDFVAAEPNESLLHALAARQAEAQDRVVIDYGLHMTITPDDIAKLDELPAVIEAGCPTFKLYMAYGFRLNDAELLQALEAVKRINGLPIIHAENWDVICLMIEQNLAIGRTEPRWHPRSRPSVMEGEAVGRVIDMATLVGTPVYIFHVSCDDAVERIASARRRGLPVFGETCPQYLLLTDAAYEEPGITGTLPVCAPPLRNLTDQARLWTALGRNELQIISTDHCPFSSADKALGLDDFSRIPGGVPSIESRFALAYSYGVLANCFSLKRWVKICCTNPARLFGLTRKGVIGVGYDADLVIFDPNAQRTLSTAVLHENVDWTPYDGFEVTGWPSVTISRGEVIVENGTFTGSAGRGQFVERQLTM